MLLLLWWWWWLSLVLQFQNPFLPWSCSSFRVQVPGSVVVLVAGLNRWSIWCLAAGFLAYTDDQSGVLLQQYACTAQIIICLHYVHILLCMHVCMVVLSFPMLKCRIVAGTCRSDEKVAGLQSQGFQAFHFNPDNDGENLKSVLIFLFFCPLFSLFLPQFLKEQFTNHMDFVYLLCASMTKFTRYVKARLQAWRHLVKLREILRYHVQFVSHLCEYTFMWQRECSTRALCCYTCLELNSACGRFQRRPSMLAAHVCDPSNWVYTII
jgi:hypothetical protein